MSGRTRAGFQIPTGAPPGLLYLPEFLSEGDENSLLKKLRQLDWERYGIVKVRGKISRRREIDFIHEYNTRGRSLSPGRDVPSFLEPLRERCESILDLEPGAIQQVITTKYAPGAPIGWHVDAKVFGGTICGISLGSSGTMRFRKKGTGARGSWRLELVPRSLIVMQGPARFEHEHEILPVTEERYSITMRTLPETDSSES